MSDGLWIGLDDLDAMDAMDALDGLDVRVKEVL